MGVLEADATAIGLAELHEIVRQTGDGHRGRSIDTRPRQGEPIPRLDIDDLAKDRRRAIRIGECSER